MNHSCITQSEKAVTPLKAWGEQLEFAKIEFQEFEYYTPEMLEYCKQDVRLTHKVAQHLDKEGAKFSSKSKRLENCVRAIVDQQEKEWLHT